MDWREVREEVLKLLQAKKRKTVDKSANDFVRTKFSVILLCFFSKLQECFSQLYFWKFGLNSQTQSKVFLMVEIFFLQSLKKPHKIHSS
jgi:hypothetical protein